MTQRNHILQNVNDLFTEWLKVVTYCRMHRNSVSVGYNVIDYCK